MADYLSETHPSGYVLSTDPARLDIPAIHRWLSEESYWARHIPRTTVERAIANSLNFGLYAPDGAQAGFCRVVTDKATFAWLCDVFVLPKHRGHGLAKWLVRQMLAHPDLQNLRRHLRRAYPLPALRLRAPGPPRPLARNQEGKPVWLKAGRAPKVFREAEPESHWVRKETASGGVGR